MKTFYLILFAALVLALPSSAQITGVAEGPHSPLVLWYRQPAASWNEALPIGNGRLGGMVFGRVDQEDVQLNEDTIWAGGPHDYANPAAFDIITKGRAMIFGGQQDEANKLLAKGDMGTPPRQMPYQPLGDLVIRFPLAGGPVTDYVRTLDLDTAAARTTYKVDGTTFTRDVFASAPDRVSVMRITADQPGMISFDATLTSPLIASQVVPDHGVLSLTGTSGTSQGLTGQVHANGRLLVQNEGGSATLDATGWHVSHANAVTLLVSAATNYVDFHDLSGDPAQRSGEALAAAAKKSYDQLHSAQLADYQALFHRVKLDLGHGANSALPTDERIRRSSENQDPALAALFFQFGRYLLISSSRPGGQPANLQGLWNKDMSPPWASKYTVNINLEMNYWLAEPTNLTECAEPLFELIRQLPLTGTHTAQVMYHAGGWVTHHNTDGWRGTAPVDMNGAGVWPLGGAWLCTHLWQHYLFSGDAAFLRQAYPVMKGACEFFLETLQVEPTHRWLVTCPSYSPENGKICAGPTMDMEILRDLFSETAQAAQVLGVDAGFQKKLADTRARLAPLQIGRLGQLQEWLQDIDDPNDHNRHASHLYALFPSNLITPETPDLFKAARQSLIFRGDGGTGWSRAWKINFWARLRDGDHANLMLLNQFTPAGGVAPTDKVTSGTLPNLFDSCPPFQIDGNFGATSGITEMLLQSQNGEIDLLPALPQAWPTGSVTGLRARGGFEVSEAWRDGKLTSATIHSTWGTAAKVRMGEKVKVIHLQPGESWKFDGRATQ